MTAELAQQGHATELKRARDLDAAQQRQLAKSATNTPSFDSAIGIFCHHVIATTSSTAVRAIERHGKDSRTQFSWTKGFGAVENYEPDRPPSLIPSHSQEAVSAPKATNKMTNFGFASQFPYPGAVVVDRYYSSPSDCRLA